MEKEILLQLLPPLKGQELLIKGDQQTGDIINEVIAAHKEFKPDYKKIAACFKDKNVYETLENIFYFLKKNIHYRIESEERQSTKSPGRILSDGYGDCKHYSNFVAGICDALGLDWKYRFASYNPFNASPGHVFVIVNDESGREIWFDAVLEKLNARFPIPMFVKDITFTKKKNAMALKRLSGLAEDYQAAYGDMPDLSNRPTPDADKDFWDVLKGIGLGALTLLTGGGKQQSGYCPPCPQQQQSINDYLLPAAAGFMIAFAIKKSKRKR